MGICSFSISSKYSNSENSSEEKIRIFEENKLNAFKNSFNSIYKLTFFDLRKNKFYVEKVFKKYFSNEILDLIKRPYFSEDSGYNTKKLNLLLFILLKPEKKYYGELLVYDKSSYLINQILIYDEEDLNKPIEKTNSKILEIIKLFVEITFEITDYYEEKERIDKTSKLYIQNIQEVKNKLPQYLLKIMFKNKCKSISYYDIDNQLTFDNWFFTSGFIRNNAYKFYKLKYEIQNKKK